MFNFKFKRKQTSKRQEEYIDKQVKKFPKVVFIIFLVYFVLFAFYMGWYIYFRNTYILSEVRGSSMQNTLNPGITYENNSDDLVYINKKATAKTGDIIVINGFYNSDGSEDKLIKRAIGFGGEYFTIKIGEDELYHVYQYLPEAEPDSQIIQIDEPYIKSAYEWRWNSSIYSQTVTVGDEKYEKCFYDKFLGDKADYHVVEANGVLFFQVPDYEIFYLGDNRAHSSDSRQRGTAKLKNIEGVAEIILSGANKEGANVFGIKFTSLFSFYWNKLTTFFAR